jgi:hypothetical protein
MHGSGQAIRRVLFVGLIVYVKYIELKQFNISMHVRIVPQPFKINESLRLTTVLCWGSQRDDVSLG